MELREVEDVNEAIGRKREDEKTDIGVQDVGVSVGRESTCDWRRRARREREMK
jgi:hypothetical protein